MTSIPLTIHQNGRREEGDPPVHHSARLEIERGRSIAYQHTHTRYIYIYIYTSLGRHFHGRLVLSLSLSFSIFPLGRTDPECCIHRLTHETHTPVFLGNVRSICYAPTSQTVIPPFIPINFIRPRAGLAIKSDVVGTRDLRQGKFHSLSLSDSLYMIPQHH